MDKTFLRWLKNTHPEIIQEYRDMLNGAIKELKQMREDKKNVSKRNTK